MNKPSSIILKLIPKLLLLLLVINVTEKLQAWDLIDPYNSPIENIKPAASINNICISDTGINNLDIYLLIGQSNMAGRANMDSLVEDTLQNVYLFDGNNFVPASNPMNKYSTVRKRLDLQKLGPAYSFGKELGEVSGKKIGLVVNARGGTKIEWWEKGYKGSNDFDLYEKAITQLEKAEKYGKLKGIIWHQGESNQNDPTHYMAQLKKLVKDLRHDVGFNVYFVAGEIGKWKKGPERINKVIDEIPKEISNADYVNTTGLEPLKGDTTNPHFNTRSQLILGQRYAVKVLDKIYNISLQ